MGRIDTLFVDKGGVLVNNDTLSAQYRRLLGDFLAPRLGRTPARWSAANVPAFERQMSRWKAAATAAAGPAGVAGWFDSDAREWLWDMCDEADVARPAQQDADRIARDALRYVRGHLSIEVPRVVDELRALRTRGLTLHVASGDAHDDLVQYLETIGARDVFDRVYGADLVNTWKLGPAYYRAVLADCGADPRSAFVIDDSRDAIAWAAECGLRGFLVERAPAEGFEEAVLRAFAEVERALG
jgi:phosphoglycolate phosphatase-like HAD superfamily hydrolase